MFNPPSLLRLVGRSLCLTVLTAAAAVRAQIDPVALAPIITTATRTPESR